MTVEEFDELMDKKSIHDRGNRCIPTLDAQTAVDILTEHFLGEDWYVVDPLTNDQVNPIVVREILQKYPRKVELVNRIKYRLKKLVESW